MSLVQLNNIHCLLGIDSKHLRADTFLNIRLQRWTSVGIYAGKTEGELMIQFSSKLGFFSNESVISSDSRIILIPIFIVTSKMWTQLILKHIIQFF